jgi:hypothetical protein
LLIFDETRNKKLLTDEGSFSWKRSSLNTKSPHPFNARTSIVPISTFHNSRFGCFSSHWAHHRLVPSTSSRCKAHYDELALEVCLAHRMVSTSVLSQTESSSGVPSRTYDTAMICVVRASCVASQHARSKTAQVSNATSSRRSKIQYSTCSKKHVHPHKHLSCLFKKCRPSDLLNQVSSASVNDKLSLLAR